MKLADQIIAAVFPSGPRSPDELKLALRIHELCEGQAPAQSNAGRKLSPYSSDFDQALRKGTTMAELKEITGISLGALRTRMYHYRHKLGAVIIEERGEAPGRGSAHVGKPTSTFKMVKDPERA